MSNRIRKVINLEFEDSTKTNGKYLVFDIETTGLPINRHANPGDFKNWPYVVQIAWLLFDDEHKLIEHNNFYLKQSVVIPADATNIHGITTAMMLEQGIEPSNVYANFKKAIDNTEYLISHNIDFDIPIVHCDFLRNGMQWDFPNNRMFCTMKTGTIFCKFPQRNGEYKWPTLTELYQKCFYPGYSMSIYPDATSTNKVHSANIDAAMTAQCFFKLKELGFFKDLETKTTTNSLSAEQIEDNFEDRYQHVSNNVTISSKISREDTLAHQDQKNICHVCGDIGAFKCTCCQRYACAHHWYYSNDMQCIDCRTSRDASALLNANNRGSYTPEQISFNKNTTYHNIDESEEWTRSDDIRYVAEIKHLGLGTFRVLKDMEKYRLDNKVEAQFKKWDEQWAKISHKKKSQADKEASLNIAEERTRDAQEKQKQIDDLLGLYHNIAN